MPEHILSLSYGKDSLACLGAIEQLGWPLDRIVQAEVWSTDTIPADLPPMVEFKAKADTIIKERWGIEVEHWRARRSYQDVFYMICESEGERGGKIYGWPYQRGPWCNSRLKQHMLSSALKGVIHYIGITADEPNRFHSLSDTKKSPLVEAGWTEADCRRWCEENGRRYRLTYPSNIWTDISIPFWSMPENTPHPTQKPEKLIAKLILASSNPGDVVFDPFLGSGTTSVVAKKLGRHYIGIEKEKEYVAYAERRLELAEANPSIQGFENGVFKSRISEM